MSCRAPASRLGLALLLAASTAAATATGVPNALEAVERPAEDVLVLELRLGRLVLRDALLAYASPGGVLLPLGELAAALDFAIAVDPAAGQAEGWFLAENRRFSLDVGQRRALVEGETKPFEPSRVELHRDDVYVEARLLERWWPVEVEVDLPKMQVRLRGRERLPVETRREREQRRRDLLTRPARGSGRFERQPLPYRLASWPVVDGRLRASASLAGGGEVRFEARHDLLLTGELVRFGAELFVSGTEDPDGAAQRSATRLRLTRQDPEGRLLGPLRAREIALGDLSVAERPLVSRGSSARGVEISSFPPRHLSEPHRTDVRGEALPGWEVELYRNGELLDFRRVGDDGRYAFERVPLVQGLNLLRTEFYGPQGQRREQVERLFVQPGSQPSHGVHYRVAFYEQGRSLLLQGDGQRLASGREGAPRLLLEAEVPAGKGLTLLAGFQSLVLDDGRHDYLSLEGSRRFGPLFGRFDVAADSRGGWAGRALVQTRVGGVDLLFEESRFFDFLSEETSAGRSGSPRRRSLLRAQGQLARRRLGFTLERQLESTQAGEMTRRWIGRLSVPSHRFSATLGADLEERSAPGQARRRRTSANLLLSGRWSRMSLRTVANYRLEPEPSLTHLASTGDLTLRAQTSLSFEVARGLAAGHFTTYRLGLARRSLRWSLGGGIAYGDGGTLQADASLAFSLGRDPHTRRWRSSWRPMARRGAAAVRVFLDRNGNGRMDPGEEPLAGVGLTRDGFAAGVSTDERGLALLSGLTALRHVDVGLDVGSLEDPFLIPGRPGVGLVPRPGRIARIELPVVIGGEIEGVVRLRDGEVVTGVARVRVELLDEAGAVLRTVETAFDGFYLFEAVPPGRYRVRAAPEQLGRLGLSASAAREAVIAGSGSMVRGADLLLRERGRLSGSTLKSSRSIGG